MRDSPCQYLNNLNWAIALTNSVGVRSNVKSLIDKSPINKTRFKMPEPWTVEEVPRTMKEVSRMVQENPPMVVENPRTVKEAPLAANLLSPIAQ